MRYKVVLHPSEEGFAVSCPGLPGCWSQGATEQEAVDNIQNAIRVKVAGGVMWGSLASLLGKLLRIGNPPAGSWRAAELPQATFESAADS
ncbi:MAG TPA: type II toxin-antitoxin system HicB family antitoxin [Candidatus Acidoferrales bacterium]|jgi:hypothetical protein|nr:type II toxin-antitoxin system HicB family antitoxin [Candidatus Acidoferrales bacterium]